MKYLIRYDVYCICNLVKRYFSLIGSFRATKHTSTLKVFKWYFKYYYVNKYLRTNTELNTNIYLNIFVTLF